MYKEIDGFNNYSINIKGDVFSSKSNKILKTQKNTRGYLFVRLHKNSKQYSFLVHRLLAFVFLELPSLNSKLEVHHKDFNILNNNLDNLKVLTKEEHLITHGILPKRCSNTNCSNKLDVYNSSGLCKYHYNQKRINDGISLEDITYWVTNFSWTRASKELGLSDNGLRKRFTKLTGKPPKDIYSYRASR